MECDLCDEALENTKTMAFPCCDRVCHSVCGIKMVAEKAYQSHQVICLCGSVLYQGPYSYWNTSNEDGPDSATRVAEVRLQARDEIKRIREKLREKNKKRQLYMSHIRSKVIEYSAAVLPHITALKLVKENTLSLMKSAPVAKEYKAAEMSYTRLQSIFKKKHSLSYYQMRSIFGYDRRSRWNNPDNVIKRKFRIRV